MSRSSVSGARAARFCSCFARKNGDSAGKAARLLKWQAVARQLEAENAALRDLNRMVSDPSLSYITVRVVGDPGGAFVRTVLINAGERNGVEKGQAAIGSYYQWKNVAIRRF